MYSCVDQVERASDRLLDKGATMHEMVREFGPGSVVGCYENERCGHPGGSRLRQRR